MTATARVTMVSTSYPADAGDWRGLFIRNLVEALARRSDITLRLWAPPGQIPQNVFPIATAAEAAWMRALLEHGGIAHAVRTGGMRGLTAPLELLRLLRRVYRRESGVDVYHVNWLQNALSLPAGGVPVLVAVLGTDMQWLRFPGMAALLRHAFGNRRVIICPNAQWMVPDLVRRFARSARIEYVPFGIDPRWFEVRPDPFGGGKRRWLCVSRLTRDKLGNLFEWGRPYFSGGVRELHLFGPMQESVAVPDWVVYHGAASADALNRDWFPGACGLISLSRHAEGRPQVMLEAMAAGLPIIASALPAHEDLLHDGDRGWICASPDELGRALRSLEEPAINHALAARARAWVKSTIGSWDDCAGRYAALYAELTR